MASVQKPARNTRQLSMVWQAIKDDKSHPTADQVYARVRRKLPNISLGTVYRNLQKLVVSKKAAGVNAWARSTFRSAGTAPSAFHLRSVRSCLRCAGRSSTRYPAIKASRRRFHRYIASAGLLWHLQRLLFLRRSTLCCNRRALGQSAGRNDARCTSGISRSPRDVHEEEK